MVGDGVGEGGGAANNGTAANATSVARSLLAGNIFIDELDFARDIQSRHCIWEINANKKR
jgi:hypothetical protein